MYCVRLSASDLESLNRHLPWPEPEENYESRGSTVSNLSAPLNNPFSNNGE